MEGSEHRIRKLTRTLAASLLLAGAVVAAGCGGGGGGSSTSPPAPANQAPSTPGGVVSADGTLGLVGPAARSTDKSQQFSDKTGKIPSSANKKTKGQQHGVAGGEACNDGGITPAADNLAQVNAAILCLVNAERADPANGSLPPLTQNAQLDSAASGMAARMVSEHFFAHDTPDGKNVVDRVQPTGYIPRGGDWVVGENLAWGSGALSTPQAIVNGWMNSPGHKANILAADYKDIGLAAAMGSPITDQSGGTVYVNNFGAKSGADLTAVLPGHDSGSSGNAAAAGATVAGTKATAKKAKAKRKAKKKRKRRTHRRKRRH
ncbi:MAG: CAP domain-containing protein [Thermoleophilaceae bacterium]